MIQYTPKHTPQVKRALRLAARGYADWLRDRLESRKTQP